MTAFNPGDFGYIDRIQPVHGDYSEDDQQNKKKRRKVQYKGRKWQEQEEDLPIGSSLTTQSREAPKQELASLYADKLYLDEVKRHFGELVTIEERVAAICFLEAEAVYDGYLQIQMEQAVLKDQIAGFVFTRGEYKRQQYLIEHLQDLAKMQLLMGNDFFHGLSFYFEGDLPLELLQEGMDEKRYADLGKAVVAQNRQVGVGFQFDRPFAKKQPRIKTSEKHLQAFRNGIWDAKGVVGKIKRDAPSYSASSQKVVSFKSNISRGSYQAPFQPQVSSMIVEQSVSESIGLRSLDFFDLTNLPEGRKRKKGALLEAFLSQFDALLLPEDSPAETIELIVELIEEKKITNEQLEKRVMRVLLMKTLLSH